MRHWCVLVMLGAVCAMARAENDDEKKDNGKKEEPTAAELKLLQGNWQKAREEYKGDFRPGEIVEREGLFIENDKMTWLFDGKDQIRRKADITLDPSKDPKTIDVEYTKGPFIGKKQLGIYRLNGDKLEICLGDFDKKKRPTKFTSKPSIGCGILYVTYKRDKDK